MKDPISLSTVLFAILCGLFVFKMYYNRIRNKSLKRAVAPNDINASSRASSPFKLNCLIILLIGSAILIVVGKKIVFGDFTGDQFRARTKLLSLNCRLSDLEYTMRPESILVYGSISDEHISHMTRLTSLSCLSIIDAKIDITSYGEVPKLSIDTLRLSRVDNRGQAVSKLIGALMHLKSIQIYDTDIDDSLLEQFMKMPYLHDIVISGAKTTDEGVNRLRLACPNMNIVTSGRSPD